MPVFLHSPTDPTLTCTLPCFGRGVGTVPGEDLLHVQVGGAAQHVDRRLVDPLATLVRGRVGGRASGGDASDHPVSHQPGDGRGHRRGAPADHLRQALVPGTGDHLRPVRAGRQRTHQRFHQPPTGPGEVLPGRQCPQGGNGVAQVLQTPGAGGHRGQDHVDVALPGTRGPAPVLTARIRDPTPHGPGRLPAMTQQPGEGGLPQARRRGHGRREGGRVAERDFG